MKLRHLYNRHLYNCHQVYIRCTSGGASILILSYKFFSINTIIRVYMKQSFMSAISFFSFQNSKVLSRIISNNKQASTSVAESYEPVKVPGGWPSPGAF